MHKSGALGRPRRLNFVQCPLIFVGPQYGTSFTVYLFHDVVRNSGWGCLFWASLLKMEAAGSFESQCVPTTLHDIISHKTVILIVHFCS